jgi:hypothetical protein
MLIIKPISIKHQPEILTDEKVLSLEKSLQPQGLKKIVRKAFKRSIRNIIASSCIYQQTTALIVLRTNLWAY